MEATYSEKDRKTIAKIERLIQDCQEKVNKQQGIIERMNGERFAKLKPKIDILNNLERNLNQNISKLEQAKYKAEARFLRSQISESQSKKGKVTYSGNPITGKVDYTDKDIVRWILVKELPNGNFDFKKSIESEITPWIGEWISSRNGTIVGSHLYKTNNINTGLKGGAYTFYELKRNSPYGAAVLYRTQDELKNAKPEVRNAVLKLGLNRNKNFPVIIKFGKQAISLTELAGIITTTLNAEERSLNKDLTNNITNIKTYGDASLISLMKLINKKEYFYVRPVKQKVANLIKELFNTTGPTDKFLKYKDLLKVIRDEVGIISYDNAIGLTLDRLVVLHFLLDDNVPEKSTLVYFSTTSRNYTPFVKGEDVLPANFLRINMEKFKQINKEHDFLGGRISQENKEMLKHVLYRESLSPTFNLTFRHIEDQMTKIIGSKRSINAEEFIRKYSDYSILYDSGNIPEVLRDNIVITPRHFANAANPPTPLYLNNLPVR